MHWEHLDKNQKKKYLLLGVSQHTALVFKLLLQLQHVLLQMLVALLSFSFCFTC